MTYKTAVQGEGAHSVWIGDVLIRAEATGTDTYELNRNLLLTDSARADSVPNLEIETGEIAGAGHASATGRFDDEQLFYLQSRGITPDEARRIVVLGFFTEILQRIGVPSLEERLVAAIEDELEPMRACSLSDLPEEGAIRVVLDGIADLRRPHPGRGVRGQRHLLARRRLAVRGRRGGRHRRVLAARLPVRPAHRCPHRPARDQAGRHLPRHRRRR